MDTNWTYAAALVLASLGGCYTGVHSFNVGTGAEGGAGKEDTGTGGPGDDDPGPTAQCGEDGVGPGVLLRLTRDEYDATVADLLQTSQAPAGGFPEDGRLGAFLSNAETTVDALHVRHYMIAAEALAADAQLHDLVGCVAPAVDDPAAQPDCATQFVQDFGRRAFRRPLDDDERATFEAVYRAEADARGFDAGLRMVVRSMLQAPQFLYRVEVGRDEPAAPEGIASLDGYEVASRLSYLLWSSMPDDELLDAAEAGVLDAGDGIEAEALRMLADPKAERSFARFTGQLLGVDELDGGDKDAATFPDFSDELVQSMHQERTRFVADVMRDDAKLSTLLTASFTYVDDRLAELYGVPGPGAPGAFVRVELPPEQRAGLLTQPGLLAAQAGRLESSVVRRGKVVRESLLCQPVSPPPPGVDTDIPEKDPDVSPREHWAQHLENPSCAGCHLLMDPIGFSFEHYDAVGRWRTKIGVWDVDADGELTNTDVDGPTVGAVELATTLSGSAQVHACAARQWIRFALARELSDDDECAVEALEEFFAENDGDIRELVVAIVRSPTFRRRRS